MSSKKLLQTRSVDLQEIASIMSEAAKSGPLPTRSVDLEQVASQVNSQMNAATSTRKPNLADIASIVNEQMGADSTGSSQTTSSLQSSATLQTSPSPTSNWFTYSTTATSTPTHIGAATSTSTPSSLDTSPPDNHKRNLAIILSVVLSLLAIAILASAILLIRRYRRRKVFLRRSITPIDDEEIDSWRMGSTAGGYPNPLPSSKRQSEQPEWTSEKTPRRPSIARAPNSRTGLTDDAIPGADPFVTPPRRHSGKLQKNAHHSLNKLARSSVEDRPPTPYQEWKEEAQTAPRRPSMPHLPSRTQSFEREQARITQQQHQHQQKWG